MHGTSMIVVEGESDRIAIEALAARRGVDLAAAAVQVVPLGGAHRIGTFLRQLGSDEAGRLGGLCDAGEETVFRRALERAGLGAELSRVEMERLGFYVCDADLEDELIRALGTAAVEEVVRANGDLRRLRALQQMPAWRGRPVDEQLRRFIGVAARRKGRYAALLVDALDLDRVPRPLNGVLAHALGH
jgi:hypothetical protein